MKQKKKNKDIECNLPQRPKSCKNFRMQYAALPYRIDPKGQIYISLITSRETHRWIIPKGWPMDDKLPCQTAQMEAFEEAGIVGHIACEPIGFYSYPKLIGKKYIWCRVAVFPLRVEQQCVIWPEKEERDGNWFAPEEAAALVQEEELAEILRSFPDSAIFVSRYNNRSLKHAQNLFS